MTSMLSGANNVSKLVGNFASRLCSRNRIARRRRLDLFDKRRIPGGSQAKQNREDRPQPVDDVKAEQQRDTEPAFLDGETLQAVRLARVGNEEQAAGRASPDFAFD